MNTSNRHRRLQKLLLMLCAFGPFMLSHLVYAQAPQEDSPQGGSQTNPIDLFRAGELVQAAGDLQKAGESFERFGKSLEKTIGILSRGMTESSENLAKVSDGFDPLGLKEAFETIQQQNQTIKDLHEAELKRLVKENSMLRKEIKRLRKMMKKDKKTKKRT